MVSSNFLFAQTIATFEDLSLQSNSYWDGSTSPSGTTFNNGNAIFPNYYDAAFSYWASGWAYSNMSDSVTAGFTNLYSAIPAKGYNNSSNYIVGQQDAIINMNSNAIGKVVNGFYVTNGTYAALSMKNGDQFAKKFGSLTNANGDVDGTNGEDWFKLTVKKWLNGVLTNDSVDFYLADFRFANNSQDYIVTDWQWVDLSSLGNVDSLKFSLTSSDVSSFGMNTPSFFCLDNFTTSDIPQNIQASNNSLISIYPNPTTDFLNINLSQFTDENIEIKIIDFLGKNIFSEKIYNEKLKTINVSNYPKGIYMVSISGNKDKIVKKIVIE